MQDLTEQQQQNRLIGCPHLGLTGDAATRTLYPTAQGCCYHVDPPTIVKQSHQQGYCLSARYTACPLFNQRAGMALPADLGENVTVTQMAGFAGLKRLATIIGLLLIFLIAVGAVWLENGRGPAEPTSTLMPALAEVAETAATIVPPVPTSSPTRQQPTATATPSPTSTQTATPAAPSATPTITAMPTATPVQFPWLLTNETPLTLRQGPGLGYPILTVLSEPDLLLEITGQSENGRWWQICCWQEEAGWLLADTVSAVITGRETAVPLISAESAPPLPRVLVQAERLNLRQEPTTESDIVAVATLDAEYEIVGQTTGGEWLQLCCEADQLIWAIRDALFVVGDETAVPVTDGP